MLIGFHYIFTAYGFWLPNDPRGSWSEVIRVFELLKYGGPTKVNTRQSVAGVQHDWRLRHEAKRALRHPPVSFDGVQSRAIALGVKHAAEESDYRVHALTVLPEHLHLVIAWHRKHADIIAAHIKARMTHAMNEREVNPATGFSPWARNHWCVYIDDAEHMRTAVRYVEKNPLKENKPRQKWSFVVPYI